ncbi:MAG: choice-of-anchor X domain-containing protein [bacterium]
MKQSRMIVLVLALLIFPVVSLAEITKVEVSWDTAQEPLNIGDTIHFTAWVDGPGLVTVGIASIHEGIQLYDDGSNGDTTANDRIYARDYRISEGDSIKNGYVFFYLETPDQKLTKQAEEKVTIYASRPLISNDSVFPLPFDPTTVPPQGSPGAKINYTLSESGQVTIKIYESYLGYLTSPDTPVEIIGSVPGKAGANQATWDGLKDDLRPYPDNKYTYVITAVNQYGNESDPPVIGNIVLSTVKLEMTNSLISPNPFSPDDDEVADFTEITFDLFLWATPDQLKVLDFPNNYFLGTKGTGSKDPRPYVLVGLKVHREGYEGFTFPHDLTEDGDTDYAPWDWPVDQNGVWLAPDGFELGFSDLLDVSDENKTNDWDTLLPLNGPYTDDRGRSYYTKKFSVGWDAENTPDGTYSLTLQSQLLSYKILFVAYVKESGIIVAEKWHMEPLRPVGYGLSAEPVTKSVTIKRVKGPGTDNQPPVISSFKPNKDEIVDPTLKPVTEISVGLEDEGCGVDFIASSIQLLDPLGVSIPARLMPYGDSILKLEGFDIPGGHLRLSGVYTVHIIARDKLGNKEEIEYTFTIEDRSAPKVSGVYINHHPLEPNDPPLTEPITEVSVQLNDGPTGSGVDLDRSDLYLQDKQGNKILGNLEGDQKNSELIFQPTVNLTSSGTYTIVVYPKDISGAAAIYTFDFELDLSANILITYQGQLYGTIYPGTSLVQQPSYDLSNLLVAEVSSIQPLPTEIRPLGKIIRFYNAQNPSQNIEGWEFTQPIKLILPYQGSDFLLGVSKRDLAVYAYTSSNRIWQALGEAAFDPDFEALSVRITRLAAAYTLAYPAPIEEGRLEDILTLSAESFNPDRGEEVTIDGLEGADYYSIRVYGLSGDQVRRIEDGQTFGWDGRDEDGRIVYNGLYIIRIEVSKQEEKATVHRLVAVIR